MNPLYKNVGVGPRRVAVLRKAYLEGRLVAYCDALLAARKWIAPPPVHHSRELDPAIVQALRDNAAYQVQIIRRRVLEARRLREEAA